MPGRLLIVDDHDGFREVARTMLEQAGFEVCEAADGAGAITAVVALQPVIVVLDIHLPDLDGFEVAARLGALPNPPTVVLVSSRPYGDVRRRVADSVVAGFIAKADLTADAVRSLAGPAR